MATMTTAVQESTVGEGLAAGCIANGVVAVSANKQYTESSFVNAWREWRCANQFPAIHASQSRNDLRMIVTKSSRRRGRIVEWNVSQTWEPVLLGEFDPQDVADILAEHCEVTLQDWKNLADAFTTGMGEERITRAE